MHYLLREFRYLESSVRGLHSEIIVAIPFLKVTFQLY